MGKKFDHRKEFSGMSGLFKTSSVAFIETTGDDSDYKLVRKNGDEHIYRCSCCIVFVVIDSVQHLQIN